MPAFLNSSPTRYLAAAAAAVSVVALAAGASAQSDLSEDEMLQRWQKQAEQIESGQLKARTRGIAVSDGRDTGTGDAEVEVGTNYGSGPTPSTPGAPAIFDRDITVDLRVTFETNSAYIRDSAARELSKLCNAMQDAPPDWTFNIIGHADASGGPQINRPLSKARAQEVARHLERECGISGSRFVTHGLGESRLLPGVPPVSEENRRVEVSINSSDG